MTATQLPSSFIINADDFGLTEGVNRAIAELSRAGALTSATLMAKGDAFDDALQIARHHPTLDVGCHVVLVDGTPVASPQHVPSLLRPQRSAPQQPSAPRPFRPSLLAFLCDLQRGRILEADVEAEAIAQIQRLQQAGIAVTHVDTHKHTHLFPRVARPLLRAARHCGVHAIRNPFEPAWGTRLTRGARVRRLEVTLLRSFHSSFTRLCAEYGIATTAGCIGISATGQLDALSLKSLLTHAPQGLYELVCHPGYNDAALSRVRTRLRDSRDIERTALLQHVPQAVQQHRLRLLSFRDLA